MRTLFVTAEPAYPPIVSADLRNWRNAQAAGALGPVLMTSLAAGREASPPLPSGIAAHSLSGLPARDIWRIDAATGEAEITVPAGAEARLAEIGRAFTPDAIVLEGLALHPLLAPLAQSGARVMIDLHEIPSSLAAERAQENLPFHPGRWRSARASARALAMLERRVAGAAAAVWVASSLDAERLRAIAPDLEALHVVPNAIPRPETAPGALQPLVEPSDGRRSILFAGDFGKADNAEAALWLAQRILPRLRKRDTSLSLVLAGRQPGPELAALAGRDGVELVADPADMEPILAGARIAVLPLQCGGAIKALESMSRGLVLVARRRAVEGLGLIENRHYRRAESERSFTRYILDLAHNLDACNTLRRAAWQHGLRHFGPSTVTRAVQRALAEKVDRDAR